MDDLAVTLGCMGGGDRRSSVPGRLAGRAYQETFHQRASLTAAYSAYSSLVRDYVESLKCWAGRYDTNMGESVAECLFKMFLSCVATRPEDHFPKFKIATERPEVTIVDLKRLVDLDNAPILGLVFPVPELGSQ